MLTELLASAFYAIGGVCFALMAVMYGPATFAAVAGGAAVLLFIAAGVSARRAVV